MPNTVKPYASTPASAPTARPVRKSVRPAPPQPAPVARPQARRDLFEAVWNLFCSVRFAVVLILLLAAATTLGTTIPQVSPGLRDFPIDYANFLSQAHARFGPLAGIMDWVGMFDLFNSFWYRLLILLLCYSIIICTLNRWGPTLRLINPTTLRSTESFLLALGEHAQFRGVPLAPAAAADALRGALRRSRYRVLAEEHEGVYYLYADRDRWSKMVTFGSHAALVLLIITAAGLTQVGWREQSVFMAPGQPLSVGHGTAFTVRQDNFRIEYFPGTTDVKEYFCDLTINQQGQDVVHKTIRVNDPLRYDNINFFLVQYQPVAKVVALDELGNPLPLTPMGQQGPIAVSGAAALQPMLLSFQMTDSDNLPMDMVQLRRPGQDTVTLQVSNYTSVPRAADENPALFVRAFIGQNFDQPLYNDFIPRQGPLVIPEVGPVRFTFTKDTATVMEIAEDYGLAPIAFWFVIMTFGFALSLYINFVRCWARITPNADDPARCDVLLGGLAEKNKVTFEAQFEKLALRARDFLIRAAGTSAEPPGAFAPEPTHPQES